MLVVVVVWLTSKSYSCTDSMRLHFPSRSIGAEEGEHDNVTIIGFLGSSAGLAIFAIGAVSGNQVLASTCAGLVSMTGMVCPFLFSQHMFLSILNSNTPLTLPQVFPSVRAIISRSADRNLQGAVQAALGLMSAFTAALGKCFRLICVQCFWSRH